MSIPQKSINTEQRAAPRYKINLERSILVTAINHQESGEEVYYVLQALLLDVSLSGLALIVSSTDAVELRQMGDALIMQMLLPLPVKSIELEVEVVRYKLLEDNEDFLIGAHITDMSGSDRIIFMEFIRERESFIQ
jgi:hypothetical protein